jgi:beta-glucosidase-like glycosyl hydrolase/CubicO group peptidase (beta-lactamase class C family)
MGKLIMKKRVVFLILLIFLILYSHCSNSILREKSRYNASYRWVEKTLTSLTLEQKIGQMILMTANLNYINEESEKWKTIQYDIGENNVFGYHLWGGNAISINHYIQKMQKIARIPLIFTADFERGVGFYIHGGLEFPTNMAVGATHNIDFAYNFGRYTALESKALGITQVFAPVVDINSNPNNPIINTRSFGETPEIVSTMATAFIRGCQENGVGCVAKHFPGHGDTDSDSHIGLPTINADAERLYKVEFVPFKAAIDENVSAIMSAHIYVPELEDTPDLPATLSETILNDILRKQLNYNGIIITDAMGMGGIINYFTPEYAYVSAIKAGCDLIINTNSSADFIINAVKNAIERGELTEERIDESVRRILTLKYNLKLDKKRSTDLDNIDKKLNTKESQIFSQTVADSAITLVRDQNNLIPVSQVYDSIFVLNIFDETISNSGRVFQSEINSRISNVSTLNIVGNRYLEYADKLLNNITDNSLVIVGAFIGYRSYKGYIDIPENQENFINSIAEKTNNIIIVSFGNPYIIRQFPQISTYLCGYGWQDVIQISAVKSMFGEIGINGKLPVSIPGIANFGDGIHKQALEEIVYVKTPKKAKPILRIGFPHEVGVDRNKLYKIEELLVKGVEDSAYPGGTFLAAKEGINFCEVAFGKLSYDKNSPAVKIGTIYDLASVTKVIGTTAAAMILYDKGLLKLDEPVASVIDEFGKNGKEKVTFRHLLTHSSGLPGWDKLWEKGDIPDKMVQVIYEMPLEYPSGTKTVYSCLGFIVLGKAIEKLADKPIDALLREEIFEPLNMTRTFYNPPDELMDKIAPTEYDKERGGIIQGKVHDENAYYLGGVSGNAGLFSTARDLAIYAQMMLNKGEYQGVRIFKEETVDLFTTRQNIVNGSTRALGWDTPTNYSSAGKYFSKSSYGHTGFTGTSIWIDPDKRLFGILLTNRIHPTRKNQKLDTLRPDIYNKLHEAIVGQ